MNVKTALTKAGLLPMKPLFLEGMERGELCVSPDILKAKAVAAGELNGLCLFIIKEKQGIFRGFAVKRSSSGKALQFQLNSPSFIWRVLTRSGQAELFVSSDEELEQVSAKRAAAFQKLADKKGLTFSPGLLKPPSLFAQYGSPVGDVDIEELCGFSQVAWDVRGGRRWADTEITLLGQADPLMAQLEKKTKTFTSYSWTPVNSFLSSSPESASPQLARDMHEGSCRYLILKCAHHFNYSVGSRSDQRLRKTLATLYLKAIWPTMEPELMVRDAGWGSASLSAVLRYGNGRQVVKKFIFTNYLDDAKLGNASNMTSAEVTEKALDVLGGKSLSKPDFHDMLILADDREELITRLKHSLLLYKLK